MCLQSDLAFSPQARRLSGSEDDVHGYHVSRFNIPEAEEIRENYNYHKSNKIHEFKNEKIVFLLNYHNCH